MKHSIRAAFLRSLPVMAGYWVLGIGFGIIFAKNGYGFWWSVAASALIYAGSMQYVLVGLLTSGASLLTTALTTLMVNARHIFYGISMIGPYRSIGRGRWYRIFALTDETYSLVCSGEAPDGADFALYTFWVSLFDHCWWVSGTAIGALAGALIPWDFAGVDFAMTALFLTVFVEQWKSTQNHIPAVVGVVSSVACLALFGPDRFLIPAMLLISIALLAGRSRIEAAEAASQRGGERR